MVAVLGLTLAVAGCEGEEFVATPEPEVSQGPQASTELAPTQAQGDALATPPGGGGAGGQAGNPTAAAGTPQATATRPGATPTPPQVRGTPTRTPTPVPANLDLIFAAGGCRLVDQQSRQPVTSFVSGEPRKVRNAAGRSTQMTISPRASGQAKTFTLNAGVTQDIDFALAPGSYDILCTGAGTQAFLISITAKPSPLLN